MKSFMNLTVMLALGGMLVACGNDSGTDDPAPTNPAADAGNTTTPGTDAGTTEPGPGNSGDAFGCYQMANNHTCDCSMTQEDCEAGGDVWTDQCACDQPELEVPTTYTFDSTFVEGESSVSYSGQVARQVLIVDLKSQLGAFTDAIDGGEEFVEASEVTAYLDYYFRFDGEADGDSAFGLSTTPAAKQSTYNDISSNKNLVGKLAGNDAKTDHKVWTDGSSFVGWTEGTTPEGLIDAWFGMVADNAVGRSAGNFRYGLDGYGEALTDPLPVHVSEAGHDLQQLVQKFLMGALCFSQGADDYMDDDTEGKGLLASNAQDEDSTYSPLAHAWDEGFGYFGAARDYADYLDKEIAGKCSEEDACERGKYFDTDGDGAIDLKSEYNFGASQNAAKRDHGSAGGDDPTDISKEALDGFLTGRAIINAAGETLNQGQMMSLKAARDHAIGGWEKALAATVVHYINDTLGDMDKFGTDDYSFTTHAKHWSEMKGFAFAFQFNPKSPLSDEDFAAVHAAFGTGPVLSNASDEEISAYKDGLISARNLLRDAYGFSEGNASTW